MEYEALHDYVYKYMLEKIQLIINRIRDETKEEFEDWLE